MQNLYIKIPDGANVVIDKLYENGHSAFVVGGCVRDFILEKEPHDWDICTDALPEQVMQIFGEKNVIPTGIKHGTVTVLIGNDNYEVTTYRIDGMYSDGRRPDKAEWVDDYVRCALFFHDIGKPKSKSTDENGCDHFYHHAAKSAEITYDILTRLRFNSKDRDIIVELVKNHDMELVATKACARRMLNKFGVDQLHRLLKIRECDNRAHSELAYPRFKNTVAFACCVEEVLDERSTFSIKNLAVNGNDLIAIGFKQGPAIGSVLNDLLNLVIDEQIQNEKAALLEVAAERLRDV